MGNEINCLKENEPISQSKNNKTSRQALGKGAKEAFLEKMNNPLVIYRDKHEENLNTRNNNDDDSDYDNKIDTNHIGDFDPINLDFQSNIDDIFKTLSNNSGDYPEANTNLNFYPKKESIFENIEYTSPFKTIDNPQLKNSKKKINDLSYNKSPITHKTNKSKNNSSYCNKDNDDDQISIENISFNNPHNIKLNSTMTKKNITFENLLSNKNTRNKSFILDKNHNKYYSRTLNQTTGDNTHSNSFTHLSYYEVVDHIKELYKIDISEFRKEYLYNREKKLRKITKRYCIKHAPIPEETLSKHYDKNQMKYCKGIYVLDNLDKSKENDEKHFANKCLFDSRDYIYWGEQNLEGKKHGYGTLIYSCGIKYEGLWVNDKFNLYGRIIDLDGTISEGFFIDEKLNGKGYQSTLIGSYRGDFLNGIKHGLGELKTENEVYIGEFEDDQKHGNGRLEFILSGNYYEGNFVNNKIDGNGVYTWTFGDVYIGEFKSGILHGIGLYKWVNGDSYEGEYRNGLRWGKGTLVNSNGNKYVGEFQDNVPHGKGKIYKKNNSSIPVEFINGVQVKNNLSNTNNEKNVDENSKDKSNQ